MVTASKRDYYDVLGVGRSAETTEIKSAYRRIAVECHPDRNPGDAAAEERFKEAAEAYAVLSDRDRRSRYDRFGHAGVEGGVGGFDADVFSDFADILGDMFGFGDMFGGRRRGASRRPQRGRDLQYTMSITLEEAASGVTRRIRIPRRTACTTCEGRGSRPGTTPESCTTCGGRGQVAYQRGFLTVAQPCPRCHGSGTMIAHPCDDCGGAGAVEREAELEVEVPAGVDTGMRLRLGSEGEAGALGGPAGDLYVLLAIEEHPVFRREGDDLRLELPVSVFQALLGARLEIPTVGGEPHELKVPAGAQPAQELRVRGEGMPRVDRRGRGDLVVELKVEVPHLSSEQRQLVEEAALAGGEEIGGVGRGLFERLRRKIADG